MLLENKSFSERRPEMKNVRKFGQRLLAKAEMRQTRGGIIVVCREALASKTWVQKGVRGIEPNPSPYPNPNSLVGLDPLPSP
jgi:hypothetical protein